MAVDKLVDSAQLDADLTSVANAIRTKGGTSASLAFPAGFVSAIGDIPSGGGGGIDPDDWIDLTPSSSKAVLTTSINRAYAFAGNPFTVIIWDYSQSDSVAASPGVFRNSPRLQFFIATSFTGSIASNSGSFLEACATLQKCDWSGSNVGGTMFTNCSSLDTLILRRSSSVVSLAGTSVFNGTPFRSGGSGGTIYIPKALYDHLGDNSSSDYKKATNWSTINGYGTITWEKIEGSIYETQYADGTPIT